MNDSLQARAGRNSPKQALAPEYTASKGFFHPLGAVAAPGVDQKIADGGDALYSATGLSVFMGANAGAAEITLTATVQDPNGNVVATEVQTIIALSNTIVGFSVGEQLPEGYSLWLNSTLTAGVYGDDMNAKYSLAQLLLDVVAPLDLSTTLQTVQEAAPGHSVFLGFLSLEIYNRDTVDHDFEIYLKTAAGESLVYAATILAGAAGNLLGAALALNSGEQLQAKILTPIVTAGRSVTVYGLAFESNQLEQA